MSNFSFEWADDDGYGPNNRIITLADTTNTFSFNDDIETWGNFNHCRLLLVQGSGILPKVVTDWGNNVVWPGGVAPTLSLTAGKKDLIYFEFIDEVYYGYLLGANFL